MAAASILPVTPSGVTNGQNIEVLTTSTPYHTATNTANEKDAVTIELHNSTAAAIEHTLEWGGAASPHISKVTIPPGDGWYPLCVARRAWGGLAIQGKGAAIGLRAQITVDRYTPAS